MSIPNVIQSNGSDPHEADPGRAQPGRRRRVLVRLALFGLVYATLRFSFMGDRKEFPFRFRERVAWWLWRDG